LALFPPPRDPPLVNPGRNGWRTAGALKRGVKLVRAGIGIGLYILYGTLTQGRGRVEPVIKLEGQQLSKLGRK
jgi:hypothetical protein